MQRTIQLAAAAALALGAILFAYYRIAGIPRVSFADSSQEEGTDPIDELVLAEPFYWPTVPVAADQVESLDDSELVIGVVANDQARAYPIQVLEVYEHVNDVIAGEPVCANWCRATLSAAVHSRRASDVELTFSFYPDLFRGNLMLIDQQTHSKWSQLGNRAVRGSMHGTRLALLPSIQTTWGHWRKLYPETEVVVPTEIGDPFFYVPIGSDLDYQQLDLVLGVQSPSPKAYSLNDLSEAPSPISDRIGDLPVIIHYDRVAHAAWATDGSGNLLAAITTDRTAWDTFHVESDYYQP